MKRNSLKIITAGVAVILIGLLFTSSARCDPTKETDLCIFIEKYFVPNSDDDGFRMALSNAASKILITGDKADITCFQQFLSKAIRENKLSFEKRKLVLFFLAESYFKLGEFDEASQYYFQVKFLIKDKSDPILGNVDQRLIESKRKVRFERKRKAYKEKLTTFKGKKDIQSFINKLLITMALLIVSGTICGVWNNRKYSEFNKTNHILKSRIIQESPKKLEQMAIYDGRVSKEAVEEFHSGIKPPRPEDYCERTRAAQLIVEGYRMIKRVNNLAPYPLAVLSKIPWLNTLHHFWQYTIFGFLVIAIQSFVSAIPVRPYNFYEKSVELFLAAALIISSLTCLRIMARTTINALDAMVSMLEIPPKKDSAEIPPSVLQIEKNVDFLFRSPWQFFIIVFVLVISFFFVPPENWNFSTHTFETTIAFIFTLIILLIACPIIWMLIGSVRVVRDISHMEDLAINPLSPLKTMGLEKWTSVISTYGLSSSVVLTFGCSIPVITNALDKNSSGLDWFWFFFIMPLLFFYWVYPYHKISSTVKQKKTERLRLVKNKIAHIFNDWKDFENDQLEELRKCREEHDKGKILVCRKEALANLKVYLEPMNNYYEMFKKIDESPESHIKLDSILELAKALGIPSLFALLSYFIPYFLS